MCPVICMITPPTSPGPAARGELIDRVRAAAGAGVHLVQIRQPDFEGGELTALVHHAVAAVGGTRARVLVNDRIDVALAAGAHGVHLRGNSVPAARVRRMVPSGFVIGRSVHSLDEAVRVIREGSLDYLTFGTVFGTASKPGAAPAGTEALATVCAASPLPVLAIGGMNQETLRAVGRTGAAGFAAIGLFADAAPATLQWVIRDSVRLFDTSAGVP